MGTVKFNQTVINQSFTVNIDKSPDRALKVVEESKVDGAYDNQSALDIDTQ